MWRVMLEFGDAEAALRLAAGPAQRDAVYRSLADRAFAEGKYEQVGKTRQEGYICWLLAHARCLLCINYWSRPDTA